MLHNYTCNQHLHITIRIIISIRCQPEGAITVKEKWNDFWWGVGFTLLGALILLFMPLLITGKYSVESGPTLFPTLLAWGLILVGSCLSIGSLISYCKMKKSCSEQDATPFSQRAIQLIKVEWKVVAFMALAVSYVLLYQRLGYFVMSFIVSTLLLLLFGSKEKRQYIAVYAAIIVLYLGFRFGLSVSLPLGSWFGL